MRPTKYGSVEFFTEGFCDYLSDVDADNPEVTANLIEGFYRALDGWFDYHDAQARTYAELRQRVRETLTV